MSLKKEEIDKLVKKLREKYREYSENHNPSWFNSDAFDERLSIAIKKRMNLEGFILAEIANFEKIKEKYDLKKKASEKTFTREVDKIIEENNARIKKYPQAVFHPSCGMEISHFYGAMILFAGDYFPALRLLVSDNGRKDMLFRFEQELEYLVLPASGGNSRRIEDHIMILRRPGVQEIDIERDKNNYLKECAFLLHDSADFCDALLENREEAWSLPMVFSRLFIEEKRKKRIAEKFKGLTGYGAILKIRDEALSIISDFRLSAFRR